MKKCFFPQLGLPIRGSYCVPKRSSPEALAAQAASGPRAGLRRGAAWCPWAVSFALPLKMSPGPWFPGRVPWAPGSPARFLGPPEPGSWPKIPKSQKWLWRS